MRQKKEFATALSTIALAAGIGFAMQQTDTAQNVYGANRTVSMNTSLTASPYDISTSSFRRVRSIQLTSAVDRTNLTADIPALADPVLACDANARAEAIANAMIVVNLDAPCRPGTPLTVHHNGMMFTVVTNEDGKADFVLPALARDAVIIMAFSEGTGAVAQTVVEDIESYSRTVLQWRGAAGLEIHAKEFGALRDGPGHVWHGVRPDWRLVRSGHSGYVTSHGDASAPEPRMAQVYTYPVDRTSLIGMIEMTIEIPVSNRNCGRDIEAQSLELQSGILRARGRTVAMPGCDDVGSTLVLNNFVPDLKVAKR